MDIALLPDFKEFLSLLHSHGVKYLLIGGYAVGYHGYPRATNDLDIWIALAPENAERVVAALRAFGFDLPNYLPTCSCKMRAWYVWACRPCESS